MPPPEILEVPPPLKPLFLLHCYTNKHLMKPRFAIAHTQLRLALETEEERRAKRGIHLTWI